MKTVIQISDFHIKASMKMPEHNPIFIELVKKLKEFDHLENPILVYNGDLIDSRSIQTYIDKEETAGRIHSVEEKESLWNEEAAKSFFLAQKYLSYLVNALNISNNRIIICCGNHDINLYASGSEKILCSSQERTYGAGRFTSYQTFLENCLGLNQWVKVDTYFKTIDGLNFLVVNSNWSNKGKGNLCINCTSILEQLKKHKDILQEGAAKGNNLFISHAPRTDYCEEALYSYEKNSHSPIMKKVKELFRLQLFGDKHTDSEYNFDYIVGAPLDSDHITCGIHQFDEENNYHHKTLRYAKGIWNLLGSEADIKEILSISRDMIKDQALKYLYGTEPIRNLEQKILSFESLYSGKSWSALDTLFRSYVTIKKPQGPGSSEAIPVKDGFINTVTRLISESSGKVSITCRGGVRQGKSVCLSVLYLNLLYRFVSGTFGFMPIYINIEKIMQQLSADDEKENRNTPEYLKKVKQRVEQIMADGARLAEKLKREACCIIDGLNKYVFYPSAMIESMVDKLVRGPLGKQYAHFIYCLDTEFGLGLTHTPQHTNKNAEYLIYFDQIKTYKIDSQEKYRNFVESFCLLRNHNAETADIIMQNIERMEILEIDMNVLVYFWEDLCVPKKDESFFSLLDNFANQKINASEMENAAKASYSLYFGGQNYSDICRECCISNQTFEVIRTQKLIAKYLQAKYYVDCIQDAVEKRGDVVDYRCINRLYDHERCSYIRRYITKINAQASIFKFAQEHYKDHYNKKHDNKEHDNKALSYSGKAVLFYLLGRIHPFPPPFSKEEVLKILDEGAKLLQDPPDTETDLYNMHIAKRSAWLSKVSMSGVPKLEISNYIRVLLSSAFERKINRNFYLQFYGDRELKDFSAQIDKIFNGFDMYCTFHILANRLKKWKIRQEDYPLLDLELFTLCDLLQVRLDTPVATVNSGGGQVPSFFYNAKYNKSQDGMALNIINFMVGICKTYLTLFENTAEENLFVRYLSVRYNDFCIVQNKLTSGALSSEDDAYNPRTLLQELTNIETTVRTGWCIPEVIKTLSKEEMNAYRCNNVCRETTLEHIFEMMSIGMLYLPETSEEYDKYDKQKILNTIWIHDLGEAHIGDSVPNYIGYDQDKEEEKKFCERLFLQGTHFGIADMTKYLELWDEWSNEEKTDYNIQVAKDLDLIQRLYKLMQILLHLKQTGESFFTKERIQEFWHSRLKIKTSEGKRVFNLLLASDKNLIPIAEEYELFLVALK